MQRVISSHHFQLELIFIVLSAESPVPLSKFPVADFNSRLKRVWKDGFTHETQIFSWHSPRAKCAQLHSLVSYKSTFFFFFFAKTHHVVHPVISVGGSPWVTLIVFPFFPSFLIFFLFFPFFPFLFPLFSPSGHIEIVLLQMFSVLMIIQYFNYLQELNDFNIVSYVTR